MKWNAGQSKCAPVREEFRTSKPGSCGSNGEVGNPIYPLLGAKRERVDTQIGFERLQLQLTYDSARRAVAAAAGSALQPDLPGFGKLWFSSFHRMLATGTGSHSYHAYRGDGRIVSFPSSSDVNDRMLAGITGPDVFDAAALTVESHDYNGRLLSLRSIDGNALTFSYSDGTTAPMVAPAAGYLIAVNDAFGRSIKFEYTLPSGGVAATDGRVTKIIDAAGQEATVSYDSAGNLQQLRWADGRARQFVYEDPSHPWALTGVVDERGVRLSTFGYDAQGHAVSTQRAGGVQHYSVSFTSAPQVVVNEVYDPVANEYHRYHDWQPPSNAVVNHPNGTSVTLQSSTVLGHPRVSQRSQPAGSGCSAATSKVAFDARGNEVMRDDFNGNRTCRVFDATRNLETFRVEGLPASVDCAAMSGNAAALPPGARRSGNEWHPEWPVVTRQVQPKVLTTWVYNGRPDPFQNGSYAACAPAGAKLPSSGQPIAVVCKKVVQSTTDEDGSKGFAAPLDAGAPAREWRWTYNQHGQVLTATDPSGGTSTYDYYTDTTQEHSVGDLRSITNAVGHVWQHLRYDRNGRLLLRAEPNGTTTEFTYSPRGWLTSTTITPASGSPEVSSVTYNEVGQVALVQLPDGTSLAYGYDSAQRLTSISDSAGNTLTYTLDNMGGRTKEELKDASGNLVSTVSRVFDALNRLQSVTGASQ